MQPAAASVSATGPRSPFPGTAPVSGPEQSLVENENVHMTRNRIWLLGLGATAVWRTPSGPEADAHNCDEALLYLERFEQAMSHREAETVTDHTSGALIGLLANDPPPVLHGYDAMWMDAAVVLQTDGSTASVGELTTALNRIESRYAEDLTGANAACPAFVPAAANWNALTEWRGPERPPIGTLASIAMSRATRWTPIASVSGARRCRPRSPGPVRSLRPSPG
jgi:hypothetical protein